MSDFIKILSNFSNYWHREVDYTEKRDEINQVIIFQFVGNLN